MNGPDHYHLQAFVLLRAIVDFAKIRVAKGFIRSKMLWAMSLYLESGHFNENWRSYHRISDAARPIRDFSELPWNERKQKLTFEHARTLRGMYRMLVDESESLTLARASEIIGEYPPVLICKSEDKEMQSRDRTFKVGGSPEDRYRHISISGFSLRSDRYQHFFSLLMEAQELSSVIAPVA